ncbi:MAG: endonuclease [Lachnospiraceae bacterium]|jgi:hypothetical protein|nr:endonuclease [Lachnospiraceae bacterium]MCI9542488.1 endonuclease [Lachnospiraceae bacterium]
MDFIEKITQFYKRIEQIKDNICTEEATKTSIILPFFQLLGYDVFNPLEFVPEYTADSGTKKGEKVDYAIIVNGEPLILVETKSINTELLPKHTSQLFRYFTVTKAKFGILTNGIVYQFYSDLDEPNKMDSKPFLIFDLFNIKKDKIEELKNFQKDNLNIKNILNNASELKYRTMIKEVIAEQVQEPSDQMIKILIKNIYPGSKTQAIVDKFRDVTKRAINEYMNDIISERLNALIIPDSVPQSITLPPVKNETSLTDEENETLDYIKNIINTDEYIVYKKTSRYAYMQIGESSLKWICRVYMQKSRRLFSLHKFPDTNYECEYYFDENSQLDSIRELIIDTFKKCCNVS